MSRIQVTINIDDTLIKEESQQSTLEDAITQELGWLRDSGMFIEDWHFTEATPEHTTPASTNLKRAVILTCVHEHAQGATLYSSVHANNQAAIEHAETVKSQCDLEEDRGEFFNFEIQPVVLDINQFQDAPSTGRHSPLDTQIQSAESRAPRPSAGEGRGPDHSYI